MQRREEPPGAINSEQEKAILALIEQPTVTKAAEVSGVATSTLYRWLKDPTFSAAYRDARKESFRHAISMTQRYAPAAIQTLMKVMQDPTAAHTAKVSAATALLKFSRESIELDDLAGRIETLERGACSSGGDGGHGPWPDALGLAGRVA